MLSSREDELDQNRLDEFERRLRASPRRRIEWVRLWKAFADAFPGRPHGREERRWMRRALDLLAERGVVVLPAKSGRRWDRSFGVELPTSVDLRHFGAAAPPVGWRLFPWHPRLQWVADLARLSPGQESFLRSVHEGLVRGWFDDPAPLRHRSLELTGDEKRLERLLGTKLFGPGRLDLDLLGCLPEVSPLAWERVSADASVLVFENAGPFTMAWRVLRALERPRYGIVAWGAGARFEASLPHLGMIRPAVDRIHYVGDLDVDGLRIAVAAGRRAESIGLPAVEPAPGIHAAMFAASRRFRHPGGWPQRRREPPGREEIDRLTRFLPRDVRDAARTLLARGRRIPEEVLGPADLLAVPGLSGR